MFRLEEVHLQKDDKIKRVGRERASTARLPVTQT